MKKRVYTGLIMLAFIASLFFLAFYINDTFYDVLIVSLLLIASHEISSAISNKLERPHILILYAVVILGYASFKLVHEFSIFVTGTKSGGLTAYFVCMIILFFFTFIYNMRDDQISFGKIISTFFCMIYHLAFMIYLVGLNYLPGQAEGLAFTGWVYDAYKTGAFVPNLRSIGVCLVFASSAGSDIFALFTGMLLKGPKLCPSISPKKTVSGALGGLFGGMFGAMVIFTLAYFTPAFGLTMFIEDNIAANIGLYLGAGLGIGFATEIGDLIASYVKRYCGIKDYGTIFPGHGGVLDRIDGMVISGTFAYLFMYVLALFLNI